MVERKKFSCLNQSINIMYPSEENMIVVPNHKKNGRKIVMPITKRMKIIMSIQVRLISRMNRNYKKKWWKEKLFLQVQSISIVYPNVESMIVVPNDKKNEDHYKIPSLSYLMKEL